MIMQALSSLFSWSERWDLNPRLLAPEASALPSCATFRIKNQIVRVDQFHLNRQALPF